MTEMSKDDGLAVVLLERFKKQRWPRAIQLKEKVDEGVTLDDSDMAFLKEVFADAQQLKPLIDRHVECKEIAAKAIQLYCEITEKALVNEQKA